jgi:hypothetical protein
MQVGGAIYKNEGSCEITASTFATNGAVSDEGNLEAGSLMARHACAQVVDLCT